MNFRALMEKTPDADLLREMIGFAAQGLMELEVAGLTGAAYGEKNPEAARSTLPGPDLGVPAGAVELRIPSCARAPTSLVPGARRHGREGADCPIHPFGRRSGSGHGMSGISNSQVSRLCQEIDDKVKAFLNRPIEGTGRIFGSTRTDVKVRQQGRIDLGRGHRGGSATAGANFWVWTWAFRGRVLLDREIRSPA